MAHLSDETLDIALNWTPPPAPDQSRLEGRTVWLERLRPDHAAALAPAFLADAALWQYMITGPFEHEQAVAAFVAEIAALEDQIYYAIFDKAAPEGRAGGVASFMRIAPEAGSIEVGSITFGPDLQQTVAATEAMYLMMQWAFEAGYRRYEWKCNARNRASRRAAERLGFSYEGVFRQSAVVKGRNRDTAWFAAIDSEWPALKAAMETWLAPDNFDADGRQRQRLSDLTAPIRVASDPFLMG
ncbi:MAG: GNAT family protein [Pseudomonadota bacterium]